ncbi:carbon-nitrogen hydrolase family protein [Jiulongibacter sp. NS-SX5]|uniref:carbon-nitrogen hydrolase family protein n=1 Tax=Jiulongibacter sp. NS-SX5 TaxID=3463854 RepID=UPI0040589B0D
MKKLFFLLCFSLFFACQSEPSQSESEKSSSARVAMAQIYGLAGDRAGNLVRIENALIEAKEKGAELVVFPETSLFGWVNPEAHERAAPIPGRDSDFLASLAQKYDLHLCIGLVEKSGEQLYDAAILIDPKGEILLKHRKINVITELMDPPYSKGDSISVIETKFGKLGLLICADSFDQNVIQRMKAKDPDILLIPYGWAAKEEQWPDHHQELVDVVTNMAKEASATVIGPNVVGQVAHGPWKGLTYGGLSVAYDYRKDSLIIGADRERDLIIFDIKL